MKTRLQSALLVPGYTVYVPDLVKSEVRIIELTR
jgi:hypothetical protein